MPNDKLTRNMELLQGKMIDTITRQYPGDTKLAQAREFTTWIHDQFTRGPLSDFARVREMESALPGAGGAAEKLLGTEGAGSAAANVSETINDPMVAQASKDYVTSQFKSIADELGPVAGQKFLQSSDTKAYVEAFPQMDRELQTSIDRLSRLNEEQRLIETSAFFRDAGATPQIAAERLLSTVNGKKAAREVMGRLGRDPDAQEAIREAAINSLGQSTKWNPVAMGQWLNSKDTRETMLTLLGPEKFRRLEDVINNGIGVVKGQEPVLRQVGRKVSTTTGTLLGALMGRMLNTGTLQAPSLGSAMGRNFVDRLFQQLPPDELVRMAIRDPKWERFLYTRIPKNMNELTRTSKQVRALVSGTEALYEDTIGE